MNYYVYYKIDEAQAEKLRPRIGALFSEVEKACAVRGRWMRRRDDPTTYMEVYEGVRDEARFEALLEREGKALGVPRHLERFISLETPA